MDGKLYFVLGAAVGSVVTGLIMKHKFDRDLDICAEDIKADYEDRLASGIDKDIAEKIASEYVSDESDDGESDSEDEEDDSEFDKEFKALTGKKRKPVKIDSTDYNKPSEAVKRKAKKSVETSDAKLSSIEEYSDNPDGYMLWSYSYFTEDQVFVDVETEEVNLDLFNWIGREILEGYTDTDTLYLRIDKQCVLLELIIHHSSYAEWMAADEY